MLQFIRIVFPGNLGPFNLDFFFLQHHLPLLPLWSYTVYFPCLYLSWLLLMNQKQLCSLFLKSKQITMASGDPSAMPPPAHHLSAFWTLLLYFSEDLESFCKFSGHSTLHRYLFSQTYCQCCVLDHKYVFTWGWCW